MAFVRYLLGLGVLALSGCYSQGDGVEPPLERVYFPTGLAISPAGTRLYVVNSDFDLQYNGGSVQALDLERLRTLIPRACVSDSDCDSTEHCDLEPTEENGGHPSRWCVASSGAWAGKPCGPFGEKTDAHELLFPGRCNYVSATNPQDGGPPLILDQVGIGAFATDVLYRRRPKGPGGRLFIPVRGDATLHYIDVIDDSEPESVPFELECGQYGNDGDCDDAHRRGDDPDEENTRGLRLLPEPFGIDATEDGEAMVVTHQTEGAASLFVNDDGAWGDGQTGFGVGPKLQFALGNMPDRPIGVVAIPEPALVPYSKLPDSGTPAIDYAPGFLVTFRSAAQINLLRYFADADRPFIQVAGAVAITANSLGYDSRGIALDASLRQEGCEALCPADKGQERLDCLKECAAEPLRVFVANRTPSTLLVGETRPNQSPTASDDLPRVADAVAMPFGPSRVIIGKIIDKSGGWQTRVFVVCFDSRRIGVYDPDGYDVETWIETGRGPHAFAIDSASDEAGNPVRSLALVGHFTDSYIGVVDLDQRHPTFGQIIATVAPPSPPRASK